MQEVSISPYTPAVASSPLARQASTASLWLLLLQMSRTVLELTELPPNEAALYRTGFIDLWAKMVAVENFSLRWHCSLMPQIAVKIQNNDLPEVT
eukprot:758091-Hanusia_phi.AAC.2